MLRPARPDDVPRIWELIRELARYEKLESSLTGSEESLRAHLFGPKPCIESILAEEGRTIVGYAIFLSCYSSFQTCPNLWLEDIYVTPDRRGKGYGLALLRAVAREAKKRGCARVEWWVLAWNEPAKEFYESIGAPASEDVRYCRLSGAALERLASEG